MKFDRHRVIWIPFRCQCCRKINDIPIREQQAVMLQNGQIQNINLGDKITLGNISVEVCEGHSGLSSALMVKDTRSI